MLLSPQRPLLVAFTALVAGASVGVGAAALGERLIAMPTPRDALAAAVSTAVVLFAHNVGVASWPLVLTALGWARIPVVRDISDVVVAAQLVGHGALIGNALQQEPGLWRFLPHLPAEWLALAVPCAVWITARRGRDLPFSLYLVAGATTVGLMAIAALLETYLVPIP